MEKGQEQLFEQYRHFFYITNDRDLPVEEVVFTANDRCDQENLIEQLKNGVHAMRNPFDNLHSNWAYMVMATSARTPSMVDLLDSTAAGSRRNTYDAQKQAVPMEFRPSRIRHVDLAHHRRWGGDPSIDRPNTSRRPHRRPSHEIGGTLVVRPKRTKFKRQDYAKHSLV